MYLLDTDTCSYYLKGLFGLESKFNEIGCGHLVVSRITLVELMVLGNRKHVGKITQSTILQLSRDLKFVDIDEPTWELFPIVKGKLISTGKSRGKFGDFDILQACIAGVHGLTLVSHNIKDYDTISSACPFEYEDWVPQE